MAGITGAHRFLILEFPEGLSPEGRVANILGKLPEGVPFWGRVTGFAVNHSPDFATRHELDGSPVEELDRAMRVGVAIASI